MRLFALTLNFKDEEEGTIINLVRVYSTEELAKNALAVAKDEYGQDVDYCLAYTTLDAAL